MACSPVACRKRQRATNSVSHFNAEIASWKSINKTPLSLTTAVRKEGKCLSYLADCFFKQPTVLFQHFTYLGEPRLISSALAKPCNSWITAQRSTWWCGPSERCRSSRCRTRTRPVDRPQSGLSTDFASFCSFFLVVSKMCGKIEGLSYSNQLRLQVCKHSLS